ncbi:peptide chain release factor 1 [bacterium]
MFKKFELFENRLKELEKLISDPEIIKDMKRFKEYTKEHSECSEKVNKYKEYKDILKQIEDLKHMAENEKDESLREMAQEELDEFSRKKEKCGEVLKMMLVPKHPFADKNTIIEIRAGTGGEEAALFAGDLFRMYTRYTERKGWKLEVIDANATELGGFKEVIFQINGEQVYNRLRFESGGHRVQRVPTTESSGRVHTSAITVAVLPEADDVDVEIKSEDIRIDTFCSSGKGGQSVNTTHSAVRITHLPTGFVVSCQDERSQLKNKHKAMKILRSRLMQKIQDEQSSLIASDRKQQVGTGDRSEKIRTYNFPQDRVTDHRIAYTQHNLNGFLDGDIDKLIDELLHDDYKQKLKNVAK